MEKSSCKLAGYIWRKCVCLHAQIQEEEGDCWDMYLKTLKGQMVGVFLAGCSSPIQIGCMTLISTPGKHIFHAPVLDTTVTYRWLESKIKVDSGKLLVVQSCLTFCNSMDCNPAGSSVHGTFQARILQWVAISFSKGLPKPGTELTSLSPALAGRFFTTSASWEARSSKLEHLKTLYI